MTCTLPPEPVLPAETEEPFVVAETGVPPAWLNESEFLVKRDVSLNSQAPVKIEEVDATAQQDVLAVIDDFAGGFIGRGAAAQIGAGFQNADAMAGTR